MRKMTQLAVILLAAFLFICGCNFVLAGQEQSNTVKQNPEVFELTEEDHQNLMDDMDILDKFLAEQERKRQEYEATNYLAVMYDCCKSKDMNSGRTASAARNEKIDTLALDEVKIDFDELYELSMVITSEAGSEWLPMDWKMMVGEVVLNRVASPEFPNTIYEVIHQKGQYAGANGSRFLELYPRETCIDAAVKLLSGDRVINDRSVLFQSNFKQGSGVYKKLYDKKLGYTYFCYSNYPGYYIEEIES